MRRVEHLRAQAHSERMQAKRRVGHLHRHATVQSEGVEEAKCVPGAASSSAYIKVSMPRTCSRSLTHAASSSSSSACRMRTPLVREGDRRESGRARVQARVSSEIHASV